MDFHLIVGAKIELARSGLYVFPAGILLEFIYSVSYQAAYVNCLQKRAEYVKSALKCQLNSWFWPNERMP
jgi:hypothetical protein